MHALSITVILSNLKGDAPPLDAMRAGFGDNFFYILFHNQFDEYGQSWPFERANNRGVAEKVRNIENVRP